MKRSPRKALKTPSLALRTTSVSVRQSRDQFASLIGGKQSFIDMARCSSSPAAREFVLRWDSLTSEEQDNTSVDSMCACMGLDPNQLTQEAVLSFSAMQ